MSRHLDDVLFPYPDHQAAYEDLLIRCRQWLDQPSPAGCGCLGLAEAEAFLIIDRYLKRRHLKATTRARLRACVEGIEAVLPSLPREGQRYFTELLEVARRVLDLTADDV